MPRMRSGNNKRQGESCRVSTLYVALYAARLQVDYVNLTEVGRRRRKEKYSALQLRTEI